MDLWDLIRIHRASQGFIASPAKLKNILWIHALLIHEQFYQCIVCLRGP